MKRSTILSFIFIVGLPLLSSANGSSVRGGGDPCENRIKNIRNDIATWIKDGGAESLSLPQAVTLEKYTQGMLQQIAKAKIQCVGTGDAGYPIQINGTPKVCKFQRSPNASLIVCDYQKFQSLGESEQYILVHHEYAGLAGLENPNGSDSTYTISNQISDYLEDEIIKKLVVKERPLPQAPLLPDTISLTLPRAEGDVKVELHDISKVAIRPFPASVYSALQDFQQYAVQGLGRPRLYFVTDPSTKEKTINVTGNELYDAIQKYHQAQKGCFIEEPGSEKMFVWLFLNSPSKEWVQVVNFVARFFDTYANYAYAHQLASASYRCLKVGGRDEDYAPWYSVRDTVFMHRLKDTLPPEIRNQYSHGILVIE